MMHNVKLLEVEWRGPFSWPKFESKSQLPSLPRLSGVYLQTFKFQDGFIIYSAGLTRRPVAKRLREHTRAYLKGEYNVLDIASAQQGIRKEIWHGWGYARSHQGEFEANKQVIVEAADRQLASFCIFIADLNDEPRMLERLEAAIMDALYQQPLPLSGLPDRGMHLSPRWQLEAPIILKNKCDVWLYGLPNLLEI